MLDWLREVIYGPRHHDVPPGPSEELEHTARELRSNLENYLNAPDPLAAFITDVYNKKRVLYQRKGNGHDRE